MAYIDDNGFPLFVTLPVVDPPMCNNIYEISSILLTHLMGMALGAGANVRACELEAPCSSPVEVATQQTFSILLPILKGPLGA